MKKIFKNLCGALMLAAALVFTSCDEIKSFIDNPVSSYLEVNPESVTLKVGEEKALEVTTISDQPISYKSSNEDVATVDEKGVITAVSEGDAIITVSVASTDTYAAGMKQVQVKVVPAIDPILTTPLTIEAKAEGGAKVKLKKNSTSLALKTIKYKKSTDTSWSDYEFTGQNGAEISLNQGESVSFWSNNAALAQGSGWWPYYSYFDISDECYVFGNVMSMIDDQEGATAENPKFSTDKEIGASRAFCYLFRYCKKILNHESKELVLPATKLTSNCYQNMFYNCEKLTKAPELKAETLEDYCYQAMFSGCTSLTKAPELKAETLAPYCYNSMFYGCSSLTEAPELKAETLANYCYQSMFSGCTSLTKAPELKAETLKDYCYASMFYGCSSLTKAPELKAETLANYCYQSMFSNCTSLTKAPELKAETLKDYCYASMFSGCTSLTEAPELKAETLANYCYQSMFSGCTSLTKAPELKAETLKEACYQRMFSGCSSLTEAPELKAETLTPGCYGSMFSSCSSLTKAPDLKAKELKESCYSSMFSYCTSLTEAPEIAAETVAPYCCQTMFAWCSSLTKAPVLKAKKLEAGCYNAMFMGCYKLGSLTCLATDITADYCVMGWLNSAGTQVEGDKILYVDSSMTEANWQFPTNVVWKVASAVD